MNTKVDVENYNVLSLSNLTESTYILRFAREGMQFRPGQHLVVGIPGSGEYREYSIYSGIHDDFLEILVKEVEEGMVSRQLKMLKPGDKIEVKGPYGFFMTDMDNISQNPVYLIASGTGIAPFHSLIRSYPEVNYQMIHGVKVQEEAYELNHYKRNRFILCTSRDKSGDYYGRLTDYLLENDINPEGRIYLCGNSHMIFDAMDILLAKGIPQRNIFTEVYF